MVHFLRRHVLLLVATIEGISALLQNLLMHSIAIDTSSPIASLDEFLFAAAVLMENVNNNSPPSSSQLPQRWQNLPNMTSSSLPFNFSMPTMNLNDKFKDGDFLYDYETQQHISQTILLTKDEQRLLELILQVRDRYSPRTTVRIAGGWVRDHLLLSPSLLQATSSLSSQDVDFVLDDLSGKEFCYYVQQYCRQEGIEFSSAPSTQHNDDMEGNSISDNLPASYHLQTASLNLFGFDLDFGRLRLEKYNRDSRIPRSVGMACAIQDAWRRDLTVNSLFFNLNTNEVEDWTEQGLKHLGFGLISTPLNAKSSILQDPLRILRAIRFAAQLSFTLDRDLVEAAQDHRVQIALQQKVSRERLGKEIDGMFQTRDPTRGVKYLLDTNLLTVVFRLDEIVESGDTTTASRVSIFHAGANVLSRAQGLARHIFRGPNEWTKNGRRLFWYAAFFHPAFDYQEKTNHANGGTPSNRSKRQKKDSSIVYHFLSRRLKRPSDDVRAVERILQGAAMVQSLLEKVSEEEVETVDAIATLTSTTDLRWKCYRELKSIDPFCWKESLLLALVTDDKFRHFELDEIAAQYQNWVFLLGDRLGLEQLLFNGDTKIEPLLDGSQVRRFLPGVSGQKFRKVFEKQEEWQVRNYNKDQGGTCAGGSNDNEELVLFLRKSFPEYTKRQR